MKNMKKLMLLALSVLLLIGAFAVVAFAENSSEAATVVYPDGSEETFAVGSTIVPKAFADGLYHGEGNTLYKDDAAAGWLFTVEGADAALSDLTVTADMAGKRIIASGADKVYMTVLKSGATTYYTDAATYANDLRNILRNTTASQTATLYSDVTFAATYTYGSGSYTMKVDLNGHTWAITGQTDNTAKVALDCSSCLYIYSSVPGGVVDVPDAAYFFRTNDRTLNSNKYYGYLRIGESGLSSTDKGQNLTVYCKQVNTNMYSSNALILGGTFIQRENSTAKYFLLASRDKAPGQGHFTYSSGSTTVNGIKNATFIVTKSSTAMMLYTHKAMSFTNCNFINTSGTYIPLLADTVAMTSSGTIGTATFSGCNFYDVITTKRAEYTKSDSTVATHTLTHSNCSFGFSGEVPNWDLDIAEATVMHYVNVATVENKEIAGNTYPMNAKLYVDLSGVLALDWGVAVDYWQIGSKPYREAGEGSMVENGYLYSTPVFDLTALSQIDENGFVIAAGSAEVGVVFSKQEPLALSYENVATREIVYVLNSEAPDAAALGDKFYELFNAPDASYVITLYQDMTLTKGVPFGKITTGSQPQYASLANGDITLDVNGRTVTVAENITGVINMSNSNDSGYLGATAAVFGLEDGANNTFTLKSSAFGGKILNLSTYALICIGERDSQKIVIDGENLEIDSVGTIVGNVEVASVALTVTGGTYTYHGAKMPFVSAGTVKISGAKIVLTNKSAQAVFALPNHQHCSTRYTVSDIEVYAQGGAKLCTYASQQTFASQNTQVKDDKVTNNLSFSDCVFVGVKVIGSMTGTNSITYDAILTDTLADLAVAYPTAPEGKSLALSTASDGTSVYKVYGYYGAETAFVTLKNYLANTTELWIPGSAYINDVSFAEPIVFEDGVYYLVEDGTVVLTVDGADVSSDPFAQALAGKTVILTLDGVKEQLFFSVKENGEYTYYSGDADAAKTALEGKLTSLGKNGYTVKLYSNMTSTSETAFSFSGGDSSKQYYYDLNGFTWTFETDSTRNSAMTFKPGDFYFYSSAPGARLVAKKSKSLLLTDTNSYVLIGENAAGSTEYGKNLTVECQRLNFQGFYGGGLEILGGTFVQTSSSKVDYFSNLNNKSLQSLRNATFIIENAKCIFYVDGVSINGDVKNSTFVSEKSVPFFGGKVAETFTKSFVNCSFYNVTPCATAGVVFTFDENCNFNYGSLDMQANGYLAYTGETVIKNIGGKDYAFTAKCLAEDAIGLVIWGYDLDSEYWQLGATATHKGFVVDSAFGYTFLPLTVVEGENLATAKLTSMKSGAMKMSLTLQSKIGLNLLLSETVFKNATVKIAGKAVELGKSESGYYILSHSVAPNVANRAIEIVITIGENEHVIACGIDSYARALIESDAEGIAKEAKMLTYAMVEYVRAMTESEDFCNVSAPAGYVRQVAEAKPYVKAEGNTILSRLRFNLADTIALEIEGAVGKQVKITFANGRIERGTIGENGSVILDELYVNDFFGDLVIEVEKETYIYNLVNYLAAMEGESEEAVIFALYNYTFFADLYVQYLLGTSDGTQQLGGRTFDASEKSRMRDGILALLYSENIAPIKLVKDMYLVAFSESPTLGDTPAATLDLIFSDSTEEKNAKLRAMVAVSLYGGEAVDSSLDSLFIGTRSFAERADLIIGDLLFVTIGDQTNLYIFDGSELVSVMNGCAYADTDAVLDSIERADRYAVVRPSLTLATLRFAGPVENPFLTDEQIALIETAKAYLLRGYRQQYDDTSMGAYGEHRWQIGQYAPEDYTSQKWGYLNCAAFTYECYRNALGYDLGARYTTRNLAAHYTNGGEIGVAEYPYYYSGVLNVPEDERIAEQEKFLETLVPGDLVVILRKGGYGHVMMYIGNGVLVHSSGSSFAYSSDSETYEPTIRYMNVQGYLFNPNSTNYLFREVVDEDSGAMRNYIYSLSIVRPLDNYNGEIPENTQNRVENLGGIVAEKLSSHPEGKTVNPSDPITFTFRIKNNGLKAKTLEIKDTVAENAALLSAGDFAYENGVLSASVTVEAGQTVEVSYTVTATGALGSKIHSNSATVGGVRHGCAPIYIENTYTEEEQAALLAAVEQFKASNPDGLKNFDLVNAIYLAAGLEAPFEAGADIRADLFETVTVSGSTMYRLNDDSEYYSMVVPTMYGGRKYYTNQQYNATTKVNTDRSRLPRAQALVAGDILVVQFSDSSGMYLYVGGDHFVNIANTALPDDSFTTTVRLMRMMSVGTYYTLLRPSMG